MCGFSLLLTKDQKIPSHLRKAFEAANQRLIDSRGPTSSNTYSSEYFICHQSILAIQSSDKKSQVLKEPPELLYNGEIYDWGTAGLECPHSSDTEELIRRCRQSTLEESLLTVDGMYAICRLLFTKQRMPCLITLYRDIAGEKHVWYYMDSSMLIISSVPGVIAKTLQVNNKLEIDDEVLADYLLRRHLISPVRHAIKGIRQVSLGSRVSIDIDKWTFNETKHGSIADLFQTSVFYDSCGQVDIENVLRDQIQKMYDSCKSDIRQSAILSGGVDSSLVTYYLSAISKQPSLDIFTMTFGDKDPVSTCSGDLLGSLENRDFMRRFLLECSLDDYYRSLLECIEILASPINTHSIPSANLVALAASEAGNSVIYGGEGADELFLGYSCYNSTSQESLYNSYTGSFSKNRALLDLASRSGINEHIENEKSYFRNILLDAAVPLDDIHTMTESYADLVVQLSNVGYITTDTINSHQGIESRTPFARKSLIGIGISLSPRQRVRSAHETKLPLTNLFNKRFGSEKNMPKMGFSGFPNETSCFLPNYSSWMVHDILPINTKDCQTLTRDEHWKLINIEHFLRLFLG